jgi:hypothetical protein
MSAPLSRALWSAAATLLVLVLTCARTHAQTCHPLPMGRVEETAFRATVGLQVATYDVGDEQGDYQGIHTAFAYAHPWFGAELLVPAYRLARESDTELGLGDMVLTARATAFSLRDAALRLGVELPVMIPTGSPSRQLGMGHAMLMPALWFALSMEPFSLRAQAGYGRVLGADSGHHHHGAAIAEGRSPLVNPMNREEVEHALTLALAIQRPLRVHARWFGALPIGDGVTRQILGGGVSADVAMVQLSAELQVPVVGDPFVVKLVTEVALLF